MNDQTYKKVNDDKYFGTEEVYNKNMRLLVV
jgi:hypothetical protein